MRAAFWISTTLTSLFLLASACAYLLHDGTIKGVRELGFPDFFRKELAVLKLAAALLLMLPFIPNAVTEWVYAGVVLFLLTAIVAHHAHGDPIALNLINRASSASWSFPIEPETLRHDGGVRPTFDCLCPGEPNTRERLAIEIRSRS